ncbi:MAG TPA: cyclase family protein [Candidatus Paceibacterota bacterium]|jgi:arylformamidase|nr:cyclase family protein [Candidatus Paceibacterota bacterium]
MKIIDISLPLNNQTPIYPNNIPVSISIHQKMPESTTQASSITFGSHTGTHIDAPAHCIEGAITLDKIPLLNLVGPCHVLDFSKDSGECITEEMIKSKNIKKNDRVILKTRNSLKEFKEFYDDYVYLDGDAADYLAGLNVLTVGIDTLSIKKCGGSDNRPHLSLLKKNIPIIEGLRLGSVAEGDYELVCLPLNFTDIDGSPARAIIIER